MYSKLSKTHFQKQEYKMRKDKKENFEKDLYNIKCLQKENLSHIKQMLIDSGVNMNGKNPELYFIECQKQFDQKTPEFYKFRKIQTIYQNRQNMIRHLETKITNISKI